MPKLGAGKINSQYNGGAPNDPASWSVFCQFDVMDDGGGGIIGSVSVPDLTTLVVAGDVTQQDAQALQAAAVTLLGAVAAHFKTLTTTPQV